MPKNDVLGHSIQVAFNKDGSVSVKFKLENTVIPKISINLSSLDATFLMSELQGVLNVQE